MMIDMEVIDSAAFKGLTLSGHVCYLSILRFRKLGDKIADQSLSQISKWANMSRSAIIRGMSELETAGLIERYPGRPGVTTKYIAVSGKVVSRSEGAMITFPGNQDGEQVCQEDSP